MTRRAEGGVLPLWNTGWRLFSVPQPLDPGWAHIKQRELGDAVILPGDVVEDIARGQCDPDSSSVS